MKMKNKKDEQIRKKAKHKKELRDAKRRKRKLEPILERPVPIKKEKEKILIVCEGKNTEPSYFNKFKLSSATIKTVGEGHNTILLVDRAKQLSEEESYDQVWCVFDKDDFPNEYFNKAVFMAEDMGFKVAYSNQAFEYWLILHFEDHQGGAMHRNQYCDKLNKYLKEFGVTYDPKSKEISDDFFEILISITNKGKSRQELACKRAERNLAFFDDNNPAKAESSTKVYLLVEEIEKYK